MIIQYKVEYDGSWACTLEFDTEIFTKEVLQDFLDFFSWHYDQSKDLYAEYAKKIAQKVLFDSMDYTLKRIIEVFAEAEGYPKLDGSQGVSLVDCDNWRFDGDYFHVSKN